MPHLTRLVFFLGLSCLGLAAVSCQKLQPRSVATTTTDPQPGLMKSEFIFETAPFPQCHASTIAESSSGLLAAWFGGTHERHPDVGIWLSRYRASHWTAPIEVANGIASATTRYPCWNPVLFQPKVGPLMLFY